MAEFAQKRANSAITTLALGAKLIFATYLHKANLMQIRIFVLCDCQISLHKGRPRFKISKEQLDFFVESGFTVPNIAGLLNVSCSTVERRMREFSISVRNKYSSVSDEELDNIILDIKRNFPNAGYKRMNGFLSQRGYTVQQHRVIESMRRVDPEGVLLRRLEMRVINRRHYHVAGPQCLWHIDENHKLIRLVLYQLFLTKRSQLGVLKCK